MVGGSWGGGISPGSLEGISRLRLCLYGLAGAVVMLLLFAVYTYAMFDEEDGPRAVPGGNEGPGFGDNGDRYFPCPRIELCVEAAGARLLTGDIKNMYSRATAVQSSYGCTLQKSSARLTYMYAVSLHDCAI
ncbi:uncharacterized protein [Dermacentor andersoni]|uniref:uncharacterized protein n=1 Tax=Dermacentor andersoni TaxID=34620 RepID=UPI00241773FC|nr:uncharacterized protein LOC126525745 [Dermacentor andersoni]